MAEGQRGRPRRNGIDRFNVSTELLTNRKFGLFLEYSGLSEGIAWMTVVRFWDFVAVNYAFGDLDSDDPVNPRLHADDGPALRRHCFYQGPSETLLKCLQKAGFLSDDLVVNGWFENQPLAEKLVNKRTAGRKGGQKTSETHVPAKDINGKFSGSKRSENADLIPILDTHHGTQSRSPNPEALIPNSEVVNSRKPGVVATLRARDAATPVETEPPANGRGSEAYLDQMAFMGRLQEFITITENDVAGIVNDLRNYPDQSNWESVFEQLNQMRVDKRLDKLRSPVGFVRKIIRGGAPDP